MWDSYRRNPATCCTRTRSRRSARRPTGTRGPSRAPAGRSSPSCSRRSGTTHTPATCRRASAWPSRSRSSSRPRPPLLLLDEPPRGLDYAAKSRLVGTLRELAADGHAIVLATHDVELAAELAHRVLILADGEIVADGPTSEVVVGSPSFAPQVTKILAPQKWLTTAQVRRALRAAAGPEQPQQDAPTPGERP